MSGIIAVIGAQPPSFNRHGSEHKSYEEYQKLIIDLNFNEWIEFKGHKSKKLANTFRVGINSISLKNHGNREYSMEIMRQGAVLETHVIENSDGAFSVWVCKHERKKE